MAVPSGALDYPIGIVEFFPRDVDLWVVRSVVLPLIVKHRYSGAFEQRDHDRGFVWGRERGKRHEVRAGRGIGVLGQAMLVEDST